MTTGRLEQEARKALKLAQGSQQLAQKELLRVVLGDGELLRELVAPVLKPLAAQMIARVLRQDEQQPGTRPATAPPPAGYNPMRATAALPDLPERPAASARHVSTLRLLAAAYQVKRGERV